MSKALSINALEAIVREVAAQNGDDWATVSEDILTRLRTLPDSTLVDIDKELRAIVGSAQQSTTSRYLQ